MYVLTLNAGSNSLKFEVVDTSATGSFGRSLVSGVYDDIGKKEASFALLNGKRPTGKRELEVRDYGHATELLFEWIESGGAQSHNIRSWDDIHLIGHRVVHGAAIFSAPARITPEVVEQIENLRDLAPLHNESALQAIRAAQAKLGDRIPMYAAFDTVFHRSIPDEAALYAIPPDLAKRYQIRRYGFHGFSHRYLMLRYAELAVRSPEQLNLITLHLEGGSSATAIRAGQSIDTSMGFTPLEGLIMGTRSGDLDPAIVPYLMRKENLDARGVEDLLNKKCGLLGVSGRSADTRDLRDHLSDPRVNLAIDMFCYRVRKYIGAYLAALGGAQAIIFGGGIGENTALVRQRICESLAWCGARFDSNLNEQADNREMEITSPGSPLHIWVIPTEEGLMLAKEVTEAHQAAA